MNQMIGTGAALGYASGSYNEARVQTEQVRAAEIPHELERLERTLESCHKELSEFAMRLEGTVMRTEPPSPAATGSNQLTAAPSTTYGARLSDMTATAAMLCARIQSMNQRLEV